MLMQHLQDHFQKVRIVAVKVKHVAHNTTDSLCGVRLRWEEGGEEGIYRRGVHGGKKGRERKWGREGGVNIVHGL